MWRGRKHQKIMLLRRLQNIVRKWKLCRQHINDDSIEIKRLWEWKEQCRRDAPSSRKPFKWFLVLFVYVDFTLLFFFPFFVWLAFAAFFFLFFFISCFGSAQPTTTMAHSRSSTILFVLTHLFALVRGEGAPKQFEVKKRIGSVCSVETVERASIGNTFCSHILFILWWAIFHLSENGEMQMIIRNSGEVKRCRAKKKSLISYWFVPNINNNTKIKAGKWCWMRLAYRFQCQCWVRVSVFFLLLFPLCWVDAIRESGSKALISFGMVLMLLLLLFSKIYLCSMRIVL